MPIPLAQLNSMTPAEFTRVIGPVFEHSPWIAQRTFEHRPFVNVSDLQRKLCRAVEQSTEDEKLSLLRAHPDLVGRLAREGKLTRESTAEQSAAGLDRLTDAEIAAFDRFNAEYRAKFDFPFIICARLNRKDAILAAFPLRLQNSPEQEIAHALAEVFKIAQLRVRDLIEE